MTLETNWSDIEFFKPSEFNYPDKVNKFLIHRLDEFRRAIKHPIIIHSDYRPGDGGYHGSGDAVDIHVKGIPLIYAYVMAEQSGLFNGIGLYPCWNNPGLHLDIRPNRARWGTWDKAPQPNGYVALDSVFFLELLRRERMGD